MDSFRKGQVFVGGIPSISKFDIEIPYEDVKYPFSVTLFGPEMYRFSINGQDIDVGITETAEGALLASFGGEMHRIVGRVEPLGLRLVLDGVTTLMPDIIDPSELRTDVTGKIVRYLQPNGANVKKGEGYVEVEAMKMIMTQVATEDGRITHNLAPGTVIAAGDLLATLDVADPSRVKQIETFAGKLDISEDTSAIDAKDALANTLAGFTNDPDAVAQKAFADAADVDASMDLITDTLEEFARVETLFDGKIPDDAIRDLIKAHSENEEEAIAIIRAHQQLDMRVKLLLAMQRQAESLRTRFGIDHFPQEMIESLEKIRKLESKEYGDLKIAADTIIRDSKAPPFDSRVDELRSQLLDENAELDKVAGSASLSAGGDMLTYLFADSDAAVRAKALEVYIRRIYRAYRLLDVSVDGDGKTAYWSNQHMDVPSTSSTVRHGILRVIPSLNGLKKELPKILNSFGEKLPKTAAGQPTNEIFIVCQGCNKDIDVESVEDAIKAQERMLQRLGVSKVNVVVPVAKQNPAYFTFPQYNGFKEDVSRRGMRPTSHHILELERLDANFGKLVTLLLVPITLEWISYCLTHPILLVA